MIQAFNINGWQRVWSLGPGSASLAAAGQLLYLKIKSWDLRLTYVHKGGQENAWKGFTQIGRNTNGLESISNFPFLHVMMPQVGASPSPLRMSTKAVQRNNRPFTMSHKQENDRKCTIHQLFNLFTSWALSFWATSTASTFNDTCARVAAAVYFGVFQVWRMQMSSRRLLSGTKSSNRKVWHYGTVD